MVKSFFLRLCSICLRTEITEEYGRVFPFPETVRYVFVTVEPVNTLMAL
jgi:hypothetical protein